VCKQNPDVPEHAGHAHCPPHVELHRQPRLSGGRVPVPHGQRTFLRDCSFILCNSFHNTEPVTFARFPAIVPVGRSSSESTAARRWATSGDPRMSHACRGSTRSQQGPWCMSPLAASPCSTGASSRSSRWGWSYPTGRSCGWCARISGTVPCTTTRWGSWTASAVAARSWRGLCSSRCCGMLHVALRVELDHGRSPERGALPGVALLRRPVHQRGLHL
jgi:hypothetical protein